MKYDLGSSSWAFPTISSSQIYIENQTNWILFTKANIFLFPLALKVFGYGEHLAGGRELLKPAKIFLRKWQNM